MKAEKDPKTGKWLIQYRYTDWQGNRRKSTKRGFATKREAEEWLRKFLMSKSVDFDMLFQDFVKIYFDDLSTRLREHTMRSKRYIIEQKLLPYFGQKRMNEIKASNIRIWQNTLIKQGFAPTYLKSINNQLNAIFNFAVRYYDLQRNPCAKAGSMGKNKADEMKFWTKDEFDQFIEAVMDKRMSYIAFMMLYWTGGMRTGVVSTVFCTLVCNSGVNEVNQQWRRPQRQPSDASCRNTVLFSRFPLHACRIPPEAHFYHYYFAPHFNIENYFISLVTIRLYYYHIS